ncbi:MAG TPA: helix-turn-helix domain-containing protein, partial [Xanthomonadales bacterium]|nr:helix-turn-helix domain-containing protein [Xanthomonadales bacterium]
MNDDIGFGTLLRSLRLAAGLSQETLAERARLSAESISALERGARRAPYRETVRLLADALDLTGTHRARLEAAAVRPARPRTPGAKEPPHNLPLALTSFHGRDRERAALQALLEDCRLITLIGPGGVGKTRLALETAAEHVKRFAGGVWFVDLAPLRSASPVAPAIAAVLHVRERAATPTEKALVTKLQASGETLLVIDNCEHVLQSAARVVELLVSTCPGVHVLATSREPLRIGGERIFAVGPLAQAPAERMFVDRSAAVGGDIDLARDSASVASIIRRLDGLPLALELAAARLRSLSPQQIADALDARFQILTAGSRTALPRHQTLHATLEWSHDLLSQREREVFRRCSIFAGSWTLAAAQPVCAGGAVGERDVAECIMSLADK